MSNKDDVPVSRLGKDMMMFPILFTGYIGRFEMSERSPIKWQTSVK